jgi:WD40 repeat protein
MMRGRLDGHTGAVYSVAFTPDERWLVSAGTDNAIRLAEFGNWRAPAVWLRGHTGHIYQVAVSPDARWLASASMDNTIRLWDVRQVTTRQTEAPLVTLRGHSDGVTSVAFSPDGSQLASGSYDGTVRLWDLRFIPDDLTILRYAAPITMRFHRDCVQGVAFSPDGTKLASASSDHTVRVYKVAQPRPYPIATLNRHADKVLTLAFSEDGRLLASGGKDQTVIVWEDLPA